MAKLKETGAFLKDYWKKTNPLSLFGLRRNFKFVVGNLVTPKKPSSVFNSRLLEELNLIAMKKFIASHKNSEELTANINNSRHISKRYDNGEKYSISPIEHIAESAEYEGIMMLTNAGYKFDESIKLSTLLNISLHSGRGHYNPEYTVEACESFLRKRRLELLKAFVNNGGALNLTGDEGGELVNSFYEGYHPSSEGAPILAEAIKIFEEHGGEFDPLVMRGGETQASRLSNIVPDDFFEGRSQEWKDKWRDALELKYFNKEAYRQRHDPKGYAEYDGIDVIENYMARRERAIKRVNDLTQDKSSLEITVPSHE